MTVQHFLRITGDRKGPIQGVAAEVMERMSNKDFEELMQEIKELKEIEEALGEWVGKVKKQA